MTKENGFNNLHRRIEQLIKHPVSSKLDPVEQEIFDWEKLKLAAKAKYLLKEYGSERTIQVWDPNEGEKLVQRFATDPVTVTLAGSRTLLRLTQEPVPESEINKSLYAVRRSATPGEPPILFIATQGQELNNAALVAVFDSDFQPASFARIEQTFKFLSSMEKKLKNLPNSQG